MNNLMKLIILIATIIVCVLLGCIIWVLEFWANKLLTYINMFRIAGVHFLGKSNTIVYMSLEPSLPDGSTLIRYNRGRDSNSSFAYKKRLDEVLERYYVVEPTGPNYVINCKEGTPPRPGSNSVCTFDVHHWQRPCTPDFGYGFQGSSRGPCIYLIFSNLPHWKPEYYNISTLPTNIPNDLKNFIQEATTNYGPDSVKLKSVWVICEGKTAADKENMGPLQYFPKFGFDGRYFPVEHKEGYINPAVAVHFDDPRTGVLINIECKAWARNLNHEKGEGVVHFELFIDY